MNSKKVSEPWVGGLVECRKWLVPLYELNLAPVTFGVSCKQMMFVLLVVFSEVTSNAG